MKIKTFVDDARGDAGGYVERVAVSLYLTPGEARDLSVSFDDMLTQDAEHDPGWHAHIRASDDSAEIVLLVDREGAAREPTLDDQFRRWLEEHAARGGSITLAVKAMAEHHQDDIRQAEELLRQHPAWRERL